MCGRLSLTVPPEALEDRFSASPPPALEPCYNVAPGEDLAAIRNDDRGRIDLLEWGLVPSWADDPGSGHINARAETVAEKPSFRDAYENRRCLVLADGYYDWADERGRGSQPYRFTRTDGEPFAMAGIWERRESPEEVRRTVAILTTEPNAVVEPIHHRMPVILDRNEEGQWLDGEPTEGLLDPYPEVDLRAYPVSDAVNDPSNDSPAVIEEVDPPEQTGLEEFTG
ncbi:MAG: SOS response-associated peptidase [Halobacteriales archaeon]